MWLGKVRIALTIVKVSFLMEVFTFKKKKKILPVFNFTKGIVILI